MKFGKNGSSQRVLFVIWECERCDECASTEAGRDGKSQ